MDVARYLCGKLPARFCSSFRVSRLLTTFITRGTDFLFSITHRLAVLHDRSYASNDTMLNWPPISHACPDRCRLKHSRPSHRASLRGSRGSYGRVLDTFMCLNLNNVSGKRDFSIAGPRRYARSPPRCAAAGNSRRLRGNSGSLC